MTEANLKDVLDRLDALLAETRRQGRASIAAQAAAESCASSVDALRESVAERAEDTSTQEQDPVALVRALVPILDAVDRVQDQARRLALSLPPPGRLARVFGARDPSPGVRALGDGLAVLASQLDQALRDSGVEIDRKIGCPVDGNAHRVVETRAAEGASAGVVIEIVRPGVWWKGRCLREADVVVSQQTRQLPKGQQAR